MNKKYMDERTPRIAVVIPSYKVKNHVIDVIAAIPLFVERIYVVDDCCPENSGQFVIDNIADSRVHVIFNSENKGVGGATMAGYLFALDEGIDIVVKIDGDGQMNPTLLPIFVAPILNGEADYTKGNRFFNLEDVKSMPVIRLFGNAVLSFVNKLSSGYWNLFDPTNGYTAIHTKLLTMLPMEKIDSRYFFESDMLFRLNTIGAVVLDIPMKAFYGDEKSSLVVNKIIGKFLAGHFRNFLKRITYNYFLRNFSIASIELLFGSVFFLGGIGFGINRWLLSVSSGAIASSGTVMLSALPIIIGFQLILSFLNFDIQSIPLKPLHRRV